MAEANKIVSNNGKRFGRVKGFRLDGNHTPEYYRLTGQQPPKLSLVRAPRGKGKVYKIVDPTEALVDLYAVCLKRGDKELITAARAVLDQTLLNA